MIVVPAPSPQIIMDLLRVIASCRRGDQRRAARELVADTRVISVIPTMITDIYHLANAAIRLGLEPYIRDEGDDEQLLLAIDTLSREDDILLTPAAEIGELYDHTGARRAADEEYSTQSMTADRRDALQWVDLEHFTSDQLWRTALTLLKESTRAYEARQLAEALACSRSALRIAQHLDSTELIAVCLFEVGYAIHSSGDGAFAEQHYRDAISLSASGGPPSWQGRFAPYVFHAGRFFQHEGNSAQAQEYFHKALLLFKESNDPEGLRACLDELEGITQSRHQG